jgi:hypothetical protein
MPSPNQAQNYLGIIEQEGNIRRSGESMARRGMTALLFPFTLLRFGHWRVAPDALEPEQIDRLERGLAAFRPCARRSVAV